MQTATSETEIKSRYLSICVHHYTLRAPCPKGQGTVGDRDFWHNGCMMLVRTAGLALMMPVPTQSLDR